MVMVAFVWRTWRWCGKPVGLSLRVSTTGYTRNSNLLITYSTVKWLLSPEPQANNYHWLSSNNSKLKGYSLRSSSRSSRDVRRENKSWQEKKKRKKEREYRLSGFDSRRKSRNSLSRLYIYTRVWVVVAATANGENNHRTRLETRFRSSGPLRSVREEYGYNKTSGSGCVVSQWAESKRTATSSINPVPVIILPFLRRNDYKYDNQWERGKNAVWLGLIIITWSLSALRQGRDCSEREINSKEKKRARKSKKWMMATSYSSDATQLDSAGGLFADGFAFKRPTKFRRRVSEYWLSPRNLFQHRP